MTTILLPVGHYLGFQAPSHWVRIGQRTEQLRGQAAAAWMQAHLGVPDEPVTELTERGLLAVLDPDGDAAEDFARRHRLRPLLTGLGPHPALPGSYAIGLPGEPIAVVPEFAYTIWHLAPLTTSIWAACEAIADLEDELATDDFELDLAEPRAVLTDLLYSLHLLLGNHAIHLDEV